VLTRLRVRHDDRGVTLVEVLVAITLLAIIMVPLSNALIAFFRNTNATNNRLAYSHDEQIAAAYFAQDVQSLGVRATTAPFALQPSIEINAAYNTGFACGLAGTPAAQLRMAWDEPTDATHTQRVIVSYVVETVGGVQQLHRLRCVAGATPSVDLVVVHNLLSYAAPVMTPTGSTTPIAISWTLNIRAAYDTGTPLVIVLYGQRRQT
jgi:prepilin-type N-terminal cleavage/methylation domain-containing protein